MRQPNSHQSALDIRPALPADVPALQSLAQALGVFAPDTAHGVWLAEQSALVGFIAWQVLEDTADLLAIAVAPAHQQRGIAQTLHAHTCPQALCTLEVRESNHAAQRLYQRLGYRQIAVRRHYYPHPQSALLRENALIFQYDNRG